jgi:hypothetical protein
MVAASHLEHQSFDPPFNGSLPEFLNSLFTFITLDTFHMVEAGYTNFLRLVR